MLVYGDLDQSELREMPKGRTPVETVVVGPGPTDRAVAYDRLRAEVEAGHQAFVVCPLVEGSPKVEAKAATEEAERLAAEELAGLRVGLLHGQMPSAEKEAAMTAFRAGEIDALVATTVIEVGVDVPNATVMIVEDADRFGLSQLHQLRGRVGRGGGAGVVLPVRRPVDARRRGAHGGDGGVDRRVPAGRARPRDPRLRARCSASARPGMGDLKLGRLPRDIPYVLKAREVAERILDEDPDLAAHRELAEEVEDLLGESVEFLFKS